MSVYEDWPPPQDRANRRQIVLGITIACALVVWLIWLFWIIQ
jgi:hypothetical protein